MSIVRPDSMISRSSVAIRAINLHMWSAERFRAVAKQHQWFGAVVGDLVVILSLQEKDFVFANRPFFPLQTLDYALAGKNQKSFRIGVIVHIRAVTWNEVKHPGS